MEEKTACSTKKILIVEDEKPVRSALSTKFNFNGFQVFEAKNGKEGLEAMKKDKPDLILVDVKMPMMGGIEMIKTFKSDSKFSEVPFIVLTNDATTETMTDVLSVGGTHYFVKADTPIEAIVAKVRLMLNCE